MNANATYMVVLSDATIRIADGDRKRVLAGLIVDRCRPLEIGIDLIDFPGPTWWVGRNLLANGMAGRDGHMDVIVEPAWPLHMSVLLRASQASDQDCTILLLRDEVRRALLLSDRVADREAESEWIERAVEAVIARCREGRRA